MAASNTTTTSYQSIPEVDHTDIDATVDTMSPLTPSMDQDPSSSGASSGSSTSSSTTLLLSNTTRSGTHVNTTATAQNCSTATTTPPSPSSSPKCNRNTRRGPTSFVVVTGLLFVSAVAITTDYVHGNKRGLFLFSTMTNSSTTTGGLHSNSKDEEDEEAEENRISCCFGGEHYKNYIDGRRCHFQKTSQKGKELTRCLGKRKSDPCGRDDTSNTLCCMKSDYNNHNLHKDGGCYRRRCYPNC